MLKITDLNVSYGMVKAIQGVSLDVPDGKLVFTEGEAQVRCYKVPEAKRFSRQFCGICGAPVARPVPEIGGIVIPAGSLDSDPGIRPQARIFWDSRAQWSCSDTLPRYPEYSGA